MINIHLLLNFIICLQCYTTTSTAKNHVPADKFNVSEIEISEHRKTNGTDIVKASYRDFALRTLIPSSRYCGFQYFDERFGSTRTSNKYPWLVDVLCNKNNHRRHYTDRCSGVLINNRYILTNKLCGVFADKVRLGAYTSDWRSSNEYPPDNDVSYQGLGEAVTSVFATVEKIIEQQDKTTEHFTIALLRLSQTVEYSDYVRPICLPLPQFPNSQDQSSLNGIGWIKERTYPYMDSSTLKRKMYTFVIGENDQCCNHTYASNACRVNTSRYLCMTCPLTSEDFLCGDDNGAPLMYAYKCQWVVGGIINSVLTDQDSWCTHNGVVDAIKITADDVDWILENISA